MNKDELHQFIAELSQPVPEAPVHQARLRYDLVRQMSKKQSFLTRVRYSLANLGDNVMAKNKKIVGLGSMSLVLVLVLSFATYSYRYSPKAVAEQLVTKSIDNFMRAPADMKDAIQMRFGSDPAETLNEAKTAKDLRVISKAEFDTEMAKAPGVFSTTLSSDPNGPVSGSVSMMSVNAAAGGQAPANVAADTSGATFSIGGSATTSTGEVTFAGEGQHITGSGEGQGMITMTGSNGTTTTGKIDPSKLAIIELKQASKYLRYTDTSGHVVILSLDEEGLPILKTILMNESEAGKPIMTKFEQ